MESQYYHVSNGRLKAKTKTETDGVKNGELFFSRLSLSLFLKVRVQEYHPQCFSQKTLLINGKDYGPIFTALEARENQPHLTFRRGSKSEEGIWVQVRGRQGTRSSL